MHGRDRCAYLPESSSIPLTKTRRANLDVLAASALIFLAAFLLFAVEPILGKLILPRFGGSAGVWTACLLFFQSALVAGYLYAHLLARIRSARLQAAVHSILLLVSLAVLPLTLPAATAAGAAPLLDIIGLLVRTIGAPFVLLASTGPLLQHWLAEGRGEQAGRSPVRLYAVSNFGSLLALVAYPLFVEPVFRVRLQTAGWSLGYGFFVAVGVAAAWVARRRAAAEPAPEAHDAAPALADRALWFLLSLAASALLLAMTSHITQDVAPVPLFWIIPLALYLVSFIAVFGWPGLYRRTVWLPAFAVALGGLMYAAAVPPAAQNLPLVLGGYSLGFFLACLVLNGELESMRPPGSRLTGYYLTIALGGAGGAVLVAAVAPALLPGPYDLPIALTLAGGIVVAAEWRARAAASRWPVAARAARERRRRTGPRRWVRRLARRRGRARRGHAGAQLLRLAAGLGRDRRCDGRRRPRAHQRRHHPRRAVPAPRRPPPLADRLLWSDERGGPCPPRPSAKRPASRRRGRSWRGHAGGVRPGGRCVHLL